MSNATADLVNEHVAILSGLEILERISAAVESGSLVEGKDIGEFIGFLKEFADKCHHGKEEGLLFPAMIAAGVPDRGGPIAVMLEEHTQGRQLIRAMEASIAGGVDRGKFTQAARGYISLLRIHIQKENNVLFPMADRLLTEDVLKSLFTKFEEHEQTVIGPGRHAELHTLLAGLQQKYPA